MAMAKLGSQFPFLGQPCHSLLQKEHKLMQVQLKQYNPIFIR